MVNYAKSSEMTQVAYIRKIDPERGVASSVLSSMVSTICF